MVLTPFYGVLSDPQPPDQYGNQFPRSYYLIFCDSENEANALLQSKAAGGGFAVYKWRDLWDDPENKGPAANVEKDGLWFAGSLFSDPSIWRPEFNHEVEPYSLAEFFDE